MAWEYKREEQRFQELAEGDYRIRIDSAEKAVSKKGNDMLVIKFDVSGNRQNLWHYISFLTDRPEITNRMLTQFFDSFKDIQDGDFNLSNWCGKVGACHVKHDEDGRAKISYFIKSNKQDSLPAWKNPNGVEEDENGFIRVPEIDPEDVPF